MTFEGFDAIWENNIYGNGSHLNRYPFDGVVSYIFRWHPRKQKRCETNILEVGCGACNNLWFAAREGFNVFGIDGSQSAIDFGKERFSKDNLTGDLKVGSFLQLPWGDNLIDLGIDRGSIVCVSKGNQQIAINEMKRVLKEGGLFYYNGYSTLHTSASSGDILSDGRVTNISNGTLTGVGALCFNSKTDIEELFKEGWEILEMKHVVSTDQLINGSGTHAEWEVIAKKI